MRASPLATAGQSVAFWQTPSSLGSHITLPEGAPPLVPGSPPVLALPAVVLLESSSSSEPQPAIPTAAAVIMANAEMIRFMEMLLDD
jgi:hypothetical protein